MNDELKQLIEDAAKLLGYWDDPEYNYQFGALHGFNPLDPERGDLMKVAMVAELAVDHQYCQVTGPLVEDGDDHRLCSLEEFTKGDYQSLALAILRAASAVYRARNNEN